MKNFFVLGFLALTASSGAFADEGELLLDASVGVGYFVADHPLSDGDLVEGLQSVLPYGGVFARYGLTNSIYAGVGFRAAYFPDTQTSNVAIAPYVGTLLGGLATASIPFTVGYRYNSPEEISGFFELSAGPTLNWWSGQVLVDPNVLDSAGLPSKLPPEFEDSFVLGVEGGCFFGIEYRPSDSLIAAIGPYVRGEFVGAPGFSAGLEFRVTWPTFLPFL